MTHDLKKAPLQQLKDIHRDKRKELFRAKMDRSENVHELEYEVRKLSTLIGLIETYKKKKVTHQNTDSEYKFFKRYNKNLLSQSFLGNKEFRDSALSELAFLSSIFLENFLEPKEREGLTGEDARYILEKLEKYGVNEYRTRISNIERGNSVDKVTGFIFSHSPKYKSAEDKEKIKRAIKLLLR